MNYQEENNALFNSFLEHTFLKGWTDKDNERYENFRRIEFILNSRCNLNCKYCYYTKFGDKLYPKEISQSDRILHNLELLLDWLIKNSYAPDVDFFSGEPLFQKVGFDALEMILDKFSKAKKKPKNIVIPTNYTFISSDELTEKVEKLLRDSQGVGIPTILSASFDGKFCEANRPWKSGDETRDNGYYDDCFRFNARHRFGFHPMIYSHLIEKWEDNFLWFQEKFEKFGIPFSNIYLLEVRNVEWTDKQIRDYMDFIRFLIEWTLEVPCKGVVGNYLDFLFKRRGYNILNNCLTTIGRGLGCSLQSCLYVRLGDLAIVPCHRQSYSQFILGKFVVEDSKIKGIEAKNPELAIGEVAFDSKTMPQCETCAIKYLCQGQCLGSMYETTGDLFSPIPTVCRLEHAKIASMIKTYKRLGIYEPIFDRLNPDKQASLRLVEKELK